MKKCLALISILSFLVFSSNAWASPWAQKQGYWPKTGGKFVFGLKNASMGWMSMFAESKEPGYATEWNGFCVGLAKSVVYTAAGVIQVATFPIPLDFPDIGRGVHLPDRPKPTPKAKGAAEGKKPKSEKGQPGQDKESVEVREDTESVETNR